jgi:hypothetical protein
MTNLNDHSKLRTYRLFKNEYGKENYLLKIIPGKYKSAFAKFRCGVAPLKIETGRYECILTENIICFNNVYHMNNCIEDKKHVLLYCPVYKDLRQYLFNHACLYNNNFMHLSDADQFIFLFNNKNMCYYNIVSNISCRFLCKIKMQYFPIFLLVFFYKYT